MPGLEKRTVCIFRRGGGGLKGGDMIVGGGRGGSLYNRYFHIFHNVSHSQSCSLTILEEGDVFIMLYII